MAKSNKYKTPGVYTNEVPSLPPAVKQVDTAIPAFIGYTEKALDVDGNNLTNKPTKISSLLQYELFFGKEQPEKNIEIIYTQQGSVDELQVLFIGEKSKHNIYNSLRFYFANGGGSCYIVSVGSYKPNVGDALLLTDFYSIGTGKGLEAIVNESEITLIIFPEGQNMAESDYYSLIEMALEQCGTLKNRFCILDLYAGGEKMITTGDAMQAIDKSRIDFPKNYHSYGAAYFPNLKTIYSYEYDESQLKVVHTIGSTPGVFDGKNLFEIGNLPQDLSDNSSVPVYYDPLLYNKIKQKLDADLHQILPASPAVAGIYYLIDHSKGVWKAPANISLRDVIAPVFLVNDTLQQIMNVDSTSGISINAIRVFTGKGILLWGARTLDGNSNEYRYISVRRLFIMVETSIRNGIQIFLTGPNELSTWRNIQAMIENYLMNLWRQGALAGSKPEHAYFVKVGLGQTMTVDDVLSGRMIIEIGLAVVRPAEFIVLRILKNL